MTNPKHTQGGWGRNITPVSKYPIIYAGRNTHVARIITDDVPPDEAEANADLISAAPELLAALKGMIKATSHDIFTDAPECADAVEGVSNATFIALAAIARAERNREPVA